MATAETAATLDIFTSRKLKRHWKEISQKLIDAWFNCRDCNLGPVEFYRLHSTYFHFIQQQYKYAAFITYRGSLIATGMGHCPQNVERMRLAAAKKNGNV